MIRRAIAVAVPLALAGLTASAGAVGARPPATDADNATPGNYGWFEAGLSWRGEFADPDVVRVGGTYYAYSAGAGGRYLGVLTSPDLVHWTIHKRWSKSPPPWLGGPDPRHDPSIPGAIRAVGAESRRHLELERRARATRRLGAARALERVGAAQLLGRRASPGSARSGTRTRACQDLVAPR